MGLLQFIVLLVTTKYLAYAAPDNRGVEFVVGYMETSATFKPVDLFVTTSKTSVVNVRITTPRYSAANVNGQFTVTSGEVYQMQINNMIRGVGTELNSKGILVTADDEVVVYGANIERFSSDVFLGYPVDVLGTEYYTVTQHPSMYPCEFMVIGVENGTSVAVTLGVHTDIDVIFNSQHYYKNDVINLNMDRFDTLQIQTMGDLTGSHISADKKVAVMSGNKRTLVPPGTSRDHLVDMMLPVDVWGRRFAIVPTPERTVGDSVRFMGSEDNTSVTITCSGGWSQSFSLDAGHHVMEITPSDQCCYVESTQAIMVILLVISQVDSIEPADPSMITIPPIEQFAADYAFATPKYSNGEYTNFFLFIVKDVDKGGLRVDGYKFPILTMYTQIPNTDFVGGHIIVSPGTHTIRHISPICVFGGFLYGRANLESYGMPAGLRMAPINKVCVPSTTEVGDGIDNDCDGLIDEELCTVANNGKDDDGDGLTEEDCATPSPIDGGYTIWSGWATCSVSCKSGLTGGTKTRTRDCTNPEPQFDGLQCVGPSADTDPCTPTIECPIDGDWGSWGTWTVCSVTCFTGSKTRTRSCDNPAPMHNGANCGGSGSETVSCDTGVPCPVEGGYTAWGPWSECSVTCGGGSSTRNRTCTLTGGTGCVGNATDTLICNTNSCPVEGGYTAWGPWSECSVTCGGGSSTRNRTCTLTGGTGCVGNATDTLICNTNSCNVNGSWGSWGPWTTCTKPCNIGQKSRERVCDNPAPTPDGDPCPGESLDLVPCNVFSCGNQSMSSDNFVGICPLGYFTCREGTIACISTWFKCDCKLDCDDGSDENIVWAACSTYCVKSSVPSIGWSLILTIAGLQLFLSLWTSI